MWFQKKLVHTTDPLLSEAPDYIGTHRIKHAHNFNFILFVPNG